MSESSDSIGLNEAADELGVHYMTVYRHVRTGRLPATRLASGWSVSRRDLDAYRAGTALPAHRRQQQVEDRLLHGDDAGVWTLIESALASAMPARAVIQDLLMPSMRSVGQRWAAGELTILEEHRASSAMSVVVSRLSPHTARVESRGGSVIVGAPAHDTHSLPSALLAQLLRSCGFPVIELGAATPPESFAEQVTASIPAAVVISIHRVHDDVRHTIDDTTAAIRNADPSTYIALGGVGISQLSIADTDADAIHNDIQQLIADLEALANQIDEHTAG